MWSNEGFVNRYRNPGEPNVPSVEGMRAHWVTATVLFADFVPYKDEIFERYELHPYAPIGATFKHLVNCIEIGTMSAAVRDAEIVDLRSGRYSQLDVVDNHRSVVTFPAESSVWRNHRHRHSWEVSASDTSAVWFLRKDLDGTQTSVWKVELIEDRPIVTTYKLPHPYELVQQGILEFYDEAGNMWMPSDSDYETLKSEPCEESWYPPEYYEMFVSGASLVIRLTGTVPNNRSIDMEDVYLYCKIESGKLVPVKQVDPWYMHWDALYKQWLAVPEEERDNSWESIHSIPFDAHPVSDSPLHLDFNDGYLYSRSTGPRHDNAVVVTHIDSEVIRWFQPEVPASELDP